MSAPALWARDLHLRRRPAARVQARDIALVVGAQGINVVRRGRDGAWRYAISLLAVDGTRPEEEQ